MSYTSFHLSALRRSAFGLALLTCAGLAAAPAHAQTRLDLGQSGTMLSGTATVTDTGTTVSGTYTYDDNGTGTPLDQQKAFGGIDAYGASTIDFKGGTVIYALVCADASTVNVSGGEITGFLDVFNTSTLNFSGGSDSAEIDTLYAGIANISGGNINNLRTYGTSTANVSGGIISGFIDASDSSKVNISGGSFANLGASDSSTINLFGTGLTETSLGFDPLYQTDVYSITGTLQNGDALNAHYYDYGGKLVFNAPMPVPEASSVMSLGILLVLGLGGLAVSARRKAQAAA